MKFVELENKLSITVMSILNQRFFYYNGRTSTRKIYNIFEILHELTIHIMEFTSSCMPAMCESFGEIVFCKICIDINLIQISI
jgi:hypothetical protein